jgi:hypothetical protein
MQERYKAGTPTVIFLTADHEELGRFHQYVKPGAFMKVLGPLRRPHPGPRHALTAAPAPARRRTALISPLRP